MHFNNTHQPIVIIGAGAAGIACALSAAKQDRTVVLVEKQITIGGTVVHALIHTLGGLFDEQGEHLNPGLPIELTERLMQADTSTHQRRIGKTMTLSVDPACYAKVVHDWLAEFSNITLLQQAEIIDLQEQHGQIEQITIQQAEQTLALKPDILVDASGHAALIRKTSSPVNDGQILAGLIMQIRGIAADALKFPKGVAIIQRIRQAIKQQKLPAECATLWLDQGVYPGEVYVKFNLPPETYDAQHMQQVSKQLITWLQNVPEFAQATLFHQGELGLREGGQVLGEYTLTEDDIRQGREFPDTLCQGNWPIEYWDPEKGVSLDYFPPGHRYNIPLSALKIKNIHNLYAVGKCLSSEPRAQASVRVAGTCWAMGDSLMRTLLSGNNHYAA